MKKINHIVARRIMSVVLLVGGVPFFLIDLKPFYLNYKMAAALFGGIEVLNFIFAFIFIRCPYCKRSLNMRGFSPDFCPCCGKDITSNKLKDI